MPSDQQDNDSLLVRTYRSRADYIADRYALFQAGWLVRDIKVQHARSWMPHWLPTGLLGRLSPFEPQVMVSYVLVETGRGESVEPQAQAPASISDASYEALQAELRAIRRERDWERARRQRCEAELNTLRAELAAIRSAEVHVRAREQAQATTPSDVALQDPDESMLATLRRWTAAENGAAQD